MKGLDKASRIVVALSRLEPDQEGRSVYIHAKGRGRLQKLMAMGIIPGIQLHVIQRVPSNEIFVLLTNS